MRSIQLSFHRDRQLRENRRILIILKSQQLVIIGAVLGTAPILSPDQFADLITKKVTRFGLSLAIRNRRTGNQGTGRPLET